MISELNKISVQGGVKVNPNSMPVLCFVDGKAVSNRMYSLVNRELNVYTETTEYITLSYGYNDAEVYNFNVVLDNFGTIIEKYDMNGKWLSGLSPNKMMVFVDGRLLENDEYELLGQDAASSVLFNVESTPYPSTATVEQTVGDKLQNLSVDVSVFEENFSPETDYSGLFTYDGANWMHYGEPVDLLEYGISFVNIKQTRGTTLSNLTINKEEFTTHIHTPGTYDFIYGGIGSIWYLNGNGVIIDEYGINFDGAPGINDIITIYYNDTQNSSATIDQITGSNLTNLAINDLSVLESQLTTLEDTTLVFTYEDTYSAWFLSGEAVELTDYSITYDGIPTNHNQIKVKYNAEYPVIAGDEIILNYIASARLTHDDVSINKIIFETQTRTSGVYSFIYNGTNWLLGDTSDVVDISDYGITLYKLPNTNDIITVTYSAEQTSAIALRFKIPGDEFHSVIIYACKTNLDTGYFNANCGETIECDYNRDRYLIFKNGYLIPNKDIYVSTGNESIIINYDYESSDIIKYVVLPNTTQTLNFATERGFLTFGPEDDFYKQLPIEYDYELVFESNVINIIDDIRTGFILASDEYNTQFLIVDDNFNKNKIKALGLNNPIARYYSDGEYYLLVPECKKINDYLSDFDQSGKLIPEILEVFQRFLLDEFHDEIQRLRNIRNLSKVDSLHIDKLLKLLGNNFDLKNKSLLQKRAILEELSSFFRILGVKNSYNIFNISDTSIGLENIEQLFTIRNNASPNSTKKVTKVTTSPGLPGNGYIIGNEYLLRLRTGGTSSSVEISQTVGSSLSNLRVQDITVLESKIIPLTDTTLVFTYSSSNSSWILNDNIVNISEYSIIYTGTPNNSDEITVIYTADTKLTNLKVKVTNVDQNGGITSLAPQINETVQELDIPHNAEYDIISIGDNACFDVESTGILYNYSANETTEEEKQSILNVLRSDGHSMVCQAAGYPGDVTFKNSGGALQIKLSVNSGSKPLGDVAAGGLIHTKVTRNVDNLGCIINSMAEYSDAYVFNSSTPSNSPSTLTLAPGIYYYEMSGGGGAGGAADSTIGDTADIPSFNGSNGEYLSGTFYVPQDALVQVYVGGGGQSSYARGHNPNKAGEPGVGYHQGKKGTEVRLGWSRNETVHYWHHLHKKSRVDIITEYDTISTGSGGGSSAILVNGRVSREARGGNGGSCISDHSANKPVFGGGNGGGGYYNIGNALRARGAKGGMHSLSDNTFTSGAGENGWVRIKKVTARYSLVLDNLLHENINIGDRFKTGIFSELLPSTIRISLNSQTINNVQINKQTFEEKVHPEISEDYVFKYNGFSWELRNTPNIVLSEYGITYEGIPNTNNTITVKYTAKTGADEFEVRITGYDAIRHLITSYDYTPKYGENFFTQKDGNVLLINDSTNGGDVFATLYPNNSDMYMTITNSSPQKYRYSLTLDETNNISRNYQPGDVLHFLGTGPALRQFAIVIDDVDLSGSITRFHFTPTTGPDEITATGVETTMGNGTGATLWITSETQTLAEANTIKEYVDFFTKEELGAIHKTEYRLNISDYGLVSEGTPNSPYPWTMGDPDEDYGRTENEGGLVTQDRDYGYVNEEVSGRWYQWWEWDRDPNYYPTNHIEVSLSPKSSSALNDALERFFSQFYKIASTVLYIHRVIANYKFGNDSIFSINEDGTVNGSILFGFMSGQPISYDKYFLTNDPARQVRI